MGIYKGHIYNCQRQFNDLGTVKVERNVVYRDERFSFQVLN